MRRFCRPLRAFQARANSVRRRPRGHRDTGVERRLASGRGGRLRRSIVGGMALMTLFALEPELFRFANWGEAGAISGRHGARALVLSDQARRFLVLQYKSYPTEFMGCMIGEVRGSTVVVHRIAPADVDPPKSAATHVTPRESCDAAGGSHTVGIIHSHPGGQNCWYHFPGTQVATSDQQSSLSQPYPIDASGNEVVWIGRGVRERQIPVVANE